MNRENVNNERDSFNVWKYEICDELAAIAVHMICLLPYSGRSICLHFIRSFFWILCVYVMCCVPVRACMPCLDMQFMRVRIGRIGSRKGTERSSKGTIWLHVNFMVSLVKYRLWAADKRTFRLGFLLGLHHVRMSYVAVPMTTTISMKMTTLLFVSVSLHPIHATQTSGWRSSRKVEPNSE